MTRARYGLILGLLFALLAGAAFIATTLLLDAADDEPASPTTTASTSSTSTSAPAGGGLATPAFVAVVESRADEASAQALADELTDQGFDSGVLRSDDYSSLNPGFWVAYTGPFDGVEGAEAEVADLVDAGYAQSYARCVGTQQECSG